MRAVVPGDPLTLDLHVQRGTDWEVMAPVLSWLLLVSGEEGVKPDLGASWNVTEGGKVYTVNLVKGAKWHDGRPVTADDVVFSVDRLAFADQLRASPWRANFKNLEKSERVDETTVRLTLKQPSASFLATLGIIGIPIYPKHLTIADYAKQTKELVIGSGPFRFSEATKGNRVRLVRNADYFKKDAQGQALPYMDGIDLFVIGDAAAEYSGFRTGRTDVTSSLKAATLRGKEKQINTDVPGAVLKIARFSWAYIAFNAASKPWDDVRMRKAISLAMDRQAFNDVFQEGLGTPYKAFATPGTVFAIAEDEIKTWPGYNPATKQKDIDEAKRLLREVGIDPATMADAVPIRDLNTAQGEVTVQLIQKALGIPWTLKPIQTAGLADVFGRRQFNVIMGANAGALADPSAELDPFLRSDSSLNVGGFKDPAVDAKLGQIETTLDQAQRVKLTQALEKEILLDKVWYVITSSFIVSHAWQGWMKGYKAFSNNQEVPFRRYEQTWLERSE